MRHTITLLTALSLLAGAPAIAQSTAAPGSMTMNHAPAAGGESMMDAMNRMNQAMSSVPMTGDADRDFVSMMIPHHQGAVDMANYELQHGKDPAMRRLATGIVAAQKKEIAEMQRWLRRHPSK